MAKSHKCQGDYLAQVRRLVMFLSVVSDLRRAAGEAENQANALRAEGVEVREVEGLGGWAISLSDFGWFPEALSED
jgi:hypothetical protein